MSRSRTVCSYIYSLRFFSKRKPLSKPLKEIFFGKRCLLGPPYLAQSGARVPIFLQDGRHVTLFFSDIRSLSVTLRFCAQDIRELSVTLRIFVKAQDL